MLLGSIVPGSTTSQAIARPSAVNRVAKYPKRRGVSGILVYYLGMGVTRLSIRLRADGLENIPRQIPYVIAANHETYVDGLWIGSFLPKHHFKVMSCIAAKDLENRHGLLGRLIVKVGRGDPHRPVRQSGPRPDHRAQEEVDEGNIMLVHPEGHSVA